MIVRYALFETQQILTGIVSWMDHPRDLLLVINQFRDEMPRPIVGIGHSFGGCHLYVSKVPGEDS